jgi:hypothetical protein
VYLPTKPPTTTYDLLYQGQRQPWSTYGSLKACEDASARWRAILIENLTQRPDRGDPHYWTKKRWGKDNRCAPSKPTQ